MRFNKPIIFSIILVVFSVSLFSQSIYDLGVKGTNYDIGKDNNGNVHLIWLQLPFRKVLYYAKIVNNQISGMETVNLDYSIHTRFSRPRMAVKPDGSQIHITYIVPGGATLVHLWRNSTGTWRENVIWQKGGSKYNMAFPAIGVDNAGNVHVIAQRWYKEVQNYVAYWRKPAGGSWPAYVRLEGLTQYPWRDFSMYTDKNGGVHATWKSGRYKIGRYRFAPSGSSLANSPTKNLPVESGYHNSFGVTYKDNSGDVHHVYFRYTDETLWHTIKRAGTGVFGELSQAATVNNNENKAGYTDPWPAIGVGPDGTPVVAWAENRNTGTVSYVNVAYKDNTLGWVPTLVDNAADVHSESRPVIAVVDTSGYMVWRGGNENLKLMVYSLNEAVGVVSPNGGEDWLCGSTHDIKWNLPNATGNVDINLYKNGVNLGPIISNIANSGIYSWTINTLEDSTKVQIGSDYKVQVRARDGSQSDSSDGFFTISTTLAVTYPTGGENFLKGSSYDITWTSSNCQSSGIKINIYRNSISVENFIEQLTGPNSGSYSWTVPMSYSDGNYVLRVKTDDNALSADSGVFSISTPAASLTVTSPKSGDNWTAGQAYDITWTKTGTQSGNVKINIFRNSVSQANYIEQIATSNDGLYSWTIPNSYSTDNYILRIKTVDNAIFDDSDVFGITNGGGGTTPGLTVISPTQCNTWYKGMTYTITWTKEGTMSNNVKLNIFKDSVTPANFIEQLTGPNTGSIAWPISSSYANGNYIVRLKTDDNQVYDDSDLFPITVSAITPPNITVTSPTSCDSWQKTKTYTITWSKSGTMSSNVKINIFKDSISPANFIEQLTGSNTGSVTWTIGSGYATGTYIIRIKTDDNAVYGDSQSFQIIN